MKVIQSDLRPSRIENGKEVMLIRADTGDGPMSVIGFFDVAALTNPDEVMVDVSLAMVIIPTANGIMMTPYMHWTQDNIVQMDKSFIYGWSRPHQGMFAFYMAYLEKTKFRHQAEHFRYIDSNFYTGDAHPTIH